MARYLKSFLLILLLACTLSASAQAPASVPAILLSDPHFDPFHDPAKATRLDAAPAAQWRGILAEPDSPTRDADFGARQKACGTRAVDTSYTLLDAELRAAHAQQLDARFVVVSGDLIAHNFDCLYRTLLPGHTPAQYDAFVQKTILFVASELRSAFPRTSIYATLGNNDSGCGDYNLDPGSTFLHDLAPTFIRSLAQITTPAALADFDQLSSYTTTLPAPFQNTRLIVLDNLFLALNYKGCDGQPHPANAAALIDWLRAQLDEATRLHQQVWVIGHLPTGVDLYNTVTKFRNICAGQQPDMFLSSNALGDTLTRYASTIRLAIFAHTHTDEDRLLEPEGSASTTGGAVAVKMLTSISPINGTQPGFTVARIAPRTATLTDYSVYTASNLTVPVLKASDKDWAAAQWTREYTFSHIYHLPAFSAATLQQLTAQFIADPKVQLPESKAYLNFYLAGDSGAQLTPMWPIYLCSLRHYDAQAFANCVCQKQ